MSKRIKDSQLTNAYDSVPPYFEEIGVSEIFHRVKLYHDWKAVVGDVIAAHTRLLDIKPPTLIIQVKESMWMNEIQMHSNQIIEAVNHYYQKELIQHVKLQLSRYSKVKASEVEVLPYTLRPIVHHRIDFNKIALPQKETDALESSLRYIQDEEMKNKLRLIRMKQLKKDIYLQQQGQKTCKICGKWITTEPSGICTQCVYSRHRKRVEGIMFILERYPYYIYDDMRIRRPDCTMEEFMEARRNLIYRYLNKLYLGSDLYRDKVWAAMLITSRKEEDLSKEFIINLANKYKRKEFPKEST